MERGRRVKHRTTEPTPEPRSRFSCPNKSPTRSGGVKEPKSMKLARPLPSQKRPAEERSGQERLIDAAYRNESLGGRELSFEIISRGYATSWDERIAGKQNPYDVRDALTVADGMTRN